MSKNKRNELKRQTIAEKLKEQIADSGLPVGAIARESGIAQPVLHRFVKGERDLTLQTADKLCVYFGLELRPVKKP